MLDSSHWWSHSLSTMCSRSSGLHLVCGIPQNRQTSQCTSAYQLMATQDFSASGSQLVTVQSTHALAFTLDNVYISFGCILKRSIAASKGTSILTHLRSHWAFFQTRQLPRRAPVSLCPCQGVLHLLLHLAMLLDAWQFEETCWLWCSMALHLFVTHLFILLEETQV